MDTVIFIILGLFIGLPLGDAISAYLRNDTSYKEDNSALSLIIKAVVLLAIGLIVFKAC